MVTLPTRWFSADLPVEASLFCINLLVIDSCLKNANKLKKMQYLSTNEIKRNSITKTLNLKEQFTQKMCMFSFLNDTGPQIVFYSYICILFFFNNALIFFNYFLVYCIFSPIKYYLMSLLCSLCLITVRYIV